MVSPSTFDCLGRLTASLVDSVADFFPNTSRDSLINILRIQLDCMISVESKCGLWRVERHASKRSYAPYIGRGWFQLTHKSNYEQAMLALNVTEVQLISILTNPIHNERQLDVWLNYFKGFRTRFIRLYKSPTLINASSREKKAIIALVWTPVSLVAGTNVGTLERVLFYRNHAQEPDVIDTQLKSN